MKKGKIFIALLAALCIGVSSTGLTACGGGSDKDPNHSSTQPPGPDDNDGTVLVKGFNVKAVDNNNKPVADIYFNVGFYNPSTFNDSYLTSTGTVTSDRSKAALLKTNVNGVATLEVDVSPDVNYKLYLADSAYIDASGTTRVIPKGYSSDFGTDLLGPITTIEFTKSDDGVYAVTANFKVDNSWGALHEPGNDLVYMRYYPDYFKDKDGPPTETYSPYAKDAKSGQPNYFTFAPYRAPMPDSTENSKEDDPATKELVAAVQAKGREAASGKYKISWKADDNSADVLLNLYSFAGGNYFQSNDDGSPTETYVVMHTGNAPTDEATLNAAYQSYKSFYGSDAEGYDTWLKNYNNTFTGTNYIILELTTDNSSTVYNFGYVSNKNCKVTIEVERIGDAAIWTSEEIVESIPADAKKAEDREGRIINAPLSANTKAVKGSDGYYHLGSADGEIIYAQLTKTTRVNTTFSMAQLADTSNTEGRAQFVITEDVYNESSNTGIHYYYNYDGVVRGYAALANSDGLYPVNDLLKTVLEIFCNVLDFRQYGENYWLAACQYYGEIPDGTENKPYILEEGRNTVSLSNGSAWVEFTPSVSGYYEFNYNVPGSVLAKDKYYVAIEAQTEFKFEVKGAGDTLSLTVNAIKDSMHLRYHGTNTEDTQVWHGTEELPLNVYGLSVYMVTIDHTAYKSPITVSILLDPLLGDGNYIIRVAGSSNYSISVKVENGYVDYNGTTLSLSSSVATLIHLDSKVDETYFIWLERAA